MKYKALFLDIDGTIIPYDSPMEKSVPSEKVTNAIKQASGVLTVCLTTGRPFILLSHVIDHLNLKGYAIINDGAQVMELQTKKILYEKVMEQSDVEKTCKILSDLRIKFYINDNNRDIPFKKSYEPVKPYNIFLGREYPEALIDTAIAEITMFPRVKVHKTHISEGEHFSLLVSHAEATKLHGIIEVSKLLKVKREETIGIGDSGNDFPLLMACGFKVAMGNAIPGLKEIADYVAPSVEKDGVADVIEKFVLSKN